MTANFVQNFWATICKTFALCYWMAVCLSVCPVCLSCLSVLSVTFVHCGMQVGLGPGHNALDGPSSPSPKGTQPPIFGLYLLRPNGCMDQDASWYGARPQPRRLCVRWGPSPPPNFRPMFIIVIVISLKHCTSLLVCSSSSSSILCILFLEKKFNRSHTQSVQYKY